ncbi:hypothetical protein [Pedobacter hartonius]|uniref:hypothetical protein n=1 Tax=Pedobacter hartonius TaxID=425514 RepID=UPI00111532B5|nr:hypothetical protein [Pedobacter hartonius]
MASGDIVSMSDLNNKPYETIEHGRAAMRLVNELSISPHNAESVLDRMIKTLQNSDLTINFGSDYFWKHLLTNSWRNVYEVNLNNNEDYIEDREDIEERLFKYSNATWNTVPTRCN